MFNTLKKNFIIINVLKKNFYKNQNLTVKIKKKFLVSGQINYNYDLSFFYYIYYNYIIYSKFIPFEVV